MLNKVRYNDSYGLDLEQVLAWRRVPPQMGILQTDKEEWNLEVYMPGNTIITFQKSDEGFSHLLEVLYKKFLFNLPVDKI